MALWVRRWRRTIQDFASFRRSCPIGARPLENVLRRPEEDLVDVEMPRPVDDEGDRFGYILRFDHLCAHLLAGLVRHLFDRGGPHQPGVAVENITTPVGFHGSGDHCLDASRPGHIGDVDEGLATGLPNLLRHLLQSSSRRAASTTLAPLQAGRKAVAAPIPLLAPVIRTTCPSSDTADSPNSSICGLLPAPVEPGLIRPVHSTETPRSLNPEA